MTGDLTLIHFIWAAAFTLITALGVVAIWVWNHK